MVHSPLYLSQVIIRLLISIHDVKILQRPQKAQSQNNLIVASSPARVAAGLFRRFGAADIVDAEQEACGLEHPKRSHRVSNIENKGSEKRENRGEGKEEIPRWRS